MVAAARTIISVCSGMHELLEPKWQHLRLDKGVRVVLVSDLV
jgi:hypothetical protein